MKSRSLRWLVASAVAATLATTGAVGAFALDKDVTLSLDGQAQQVHGFNSTVADVLEHANVSLGEHDVVAPALDTKVSDGQEIAVRYGRLLTVTIDGVQKEFWTTATTVLSAIDELGIRDAEDAKLSVSRDAAVGREGLSVTITTPKDVTIKADGKTHTVESTSATVADLLTELGITLDSDDTVSQDLSGTVTDGLKVAVQRVEVKKVTKSKELDYKSVTKNDADLGQGIRKTTQTGKKGEAEVTYRVTYVDGKATTRKVVKQVVITKPVNEVVTVGTNTRTGLNLARAAMWDRIARCESTNRWNINTGNGYYGGLQFNLQTWLSVNGDDFAPYPHQATREEQITVANRLYAKRGLQPWECKP